MSDYTKAKGFIKTINDLKLKGVEKFKYVGLKKDAMLERFMEAVEAVDDAGKLNKMPTDLIDFYESFVEEEDVDEEEVEDDDAEDTDDDEDDEWEDVDDDVDEEDDAAVDSDEDEDDDLEDEDDDDLDDDDLEDEDDDEEEDEDDDDLEDEDDDDLEEEEEPEPPKKKKGKKAAKPKAKAKAKPKKKAKAEKPAKKGKKKKVAEKPEKPAKGKKGKKKKVAEEKKPRTVKATTRMSARITDGVLTLKYGDAKPKKLKVQKADKGKLKKTIAKVVKWAKDVGATAGQVQAVKKAFTSKGYHVTKS